MNAQVKKDLEDALVLINKAAKEEKDELRQIIHDKYTDIKTVFADKISQGTEAVTHTITSVDKKIKENPWPYVAGAAAGAFILGFLLHRNNDK